MVPTTRSKKGAQRAQEVILATYECDLRKKYKLNILPSNLVNLAGWVPEVPNPHYKDLRIPRLSSTSHIFSRNEKNKLRK